MFRFEGDRIGRGFTTSSLLKDLMKVGGCWRSQGTVWWIVRDPSIVVLISLKTGPQVDVTLAIMNPPNRTQPRQTEFLLTKVFINWSKRTRNSKQIAKSIAIIYWSRQRVFINKLTATKRRDGLLGNKLSTWDRKDIAGCNLFDFMKNYRWGPFKHTTEYVKRTSRSLITHRW